jgi:hypothetical protein
VDNANPCDDNSACTQDDSCKNGVCAGVPWPAPFEVDNGVRIDRSGPNRVVSWNLATNATSSELIRGTLTGLPVGPGGVAETCLGGYTGTTMTDNSSPPPNIGYWYLVRGVSACAGKGSWGYQGVRGAPGIERTTTTCP